MLPVLQDGRLVGVVSDTDLKQASASPATTLDMHELLYLISKIKVKDIMTRNPVVVHPHHTVEEVAATLKSRHISGAPVLDDAGQVVGIITRDDLFDVLISLTGLGKKGVQYAFRVEDKPGIIKALADTVGKYGARIASVLSTVDNVPEGFKRVYIRAYNIDRAKAPQLLEELKAMAAMLYYVDHRDNQREIFIDN
jgi:acetoin utilization protein AcuB